VLPGDVVIEEGRDVKMSNVSDLITFWLDVVERVLSGVYMNSVVLIGENMSGDEVVMGEDMDEME
jgi:hypothetical protein